MRIQWTSFDRIWRSVQKLGRPRPVATFALLFVLLGLALIWWIAPHVNWSGRAHFGSLVLRCALTATLGMVAITVWTLTSRRRRGGDQRKQEAAPTAESGPSAVRVLEAELEANVAVLRASGRRGRIDRLPWYLVIGSEGSGKSSFIHRSDQRFAVSAMRQAGVPVGRHEDLSPDRLTHWWVGDDAVLIEPSASLSLRPAAASAHTAASGSPLWYGLLGWLARRRARPCINGVVLVIEFPDFATQSASDRRARSLVLRARLQELMSSVGGPVPVYIILSKIDLLEGFGEFFARMPRATRDRALGFTFPLHAGAAGQNWRSELCTQYGVLMGRLNEQVLDAMGEQHTLDARERMFSFVRQMAGLQPALVDFLDDLMSTDRHTKSPLMRGVFFSSVCQQGILFNAFVAEGARSNDLPAAVPSSHGSEPSTIHFSRHVFRDLIYPEAGLAGDAHDGSARGATHLWKGWAPASLVLLSGVACWHHYFVSSRAQAVEVLSRTEVVDRKQMLTVSDALGIDLLAPMNELRKTRLVYDGGGSAWTLLSQLGLYQGHRIGPHADAAYARMLSREFLPALALGLLDTMEKATPGSESQLAALRVYRMIDDRDNRQKMVVENWMGDMLQPPLTGQAVARDQLMQHLDYALEHADPELSSYQPRIARIQASFGHLRLPERVYAGLKADVARENLPPVRLRDVTGPIFDAVFTTADPRDGASPAVDALFTSRGASDYFNAFRPLVADRALQDQWVIGNRTSIRYSQADKKVLIHGVEDLYSSDYAGHWSRALASMHVRKFDSLSGAVSILGKVTGPEAPFRRLLQSVRENTPAGFASSATPGMTAGVTPGVAAGLSAMPKTPLLAKLSSALDAHGQDPSSYDQIIAATSRLHDYLQVIATSPDQGKAALQAMADRHQGGSPDPMSELASMGRDFPKPFGEQFVRMAEASEALIRAEAMAQIQKEWQTQVYAFYNQRLRTRYPFSPAAAGDASIDDFVELFGPQGRLARFDETYLPLMRTGGHAEPDATRRIRDAFFNKDGEFGLQFTLEPLGLTPNRRNSVFELDGQLVGYSHGPSIPAGLIWPNTVREGAISRVTLVTTTGSSQTAMFKGPWSLFRLLSQGHPGSTAPGNIELTFTAGDGAVRYRIATTRVDNPFNQRLFAGFSLPASILPPADVPAPATTTREDRHGT